MKMRWLIPAMVLVLVGLVCEAEEATLQTEKEKTGYALGVSIVRNIRLQGVEVDTDAVMKGMKDALTNKQLLMSDEEIKKTMAIHQSAARFKQREARKIAGDKLNNEKQGEAFLAENKKKEGVVNLPSGLQYKIVKAGQGRSPAATDTVEVRYRGTLINGTEFDNSERAGKPAVFKLTDVIPGWREAVTLMPVGSRWQIFVPPELAYGEQGSPPQIGPKATLIFEIELIAIK